jgi:hypothetical protein
MYAIEIHCGFMIAGYEPKFRNCRVTKNQEEALAFKTKKEAKAFIMAHINEGTNTTNKVIALNLEHTEEDGNKVNLHTQAKLKNLQVTVSPSRSEVTHMFVEKMAREIQKLTGLKTTSKTIFGTMYFIVEQSNMSSLVLRKQLKTYYSALVERGFDFKVKTLKA